MTEDLVVVFAGGPVQAGTVRSRLEADGLTAFLQDENMGLMHPWALGGGSDASVKVAVPRSEAQRAREVIADIGA